jgi:hypothetical protein
MRPVAELRFGKEEKLGTIDGARKHSTLPEPDSTHARP